MAAAARGGSQASAKPRPQSAQKRSAQPKRPAARRGAPAPEGGGGLSPKHALMAAGGVLVLALVVTLATGHRGEHIVQAVGTGIDGKFGDAGFKLAAIHVEGASPMATADIVKATGVYKDEPLLGLKLDDVRKRVEGVGWVKEARVVRLLPDTLVVAVVERKQLAIWQREGKTSVIDDKGQVIAEADPARFPSLPLVVGEGGAEHAPEVLPVLAQRRKLMERMDALVRVDNRRWDLRMKDGGLIQLPAVGEEEALMQLEQLDERARILELGFARIDLRNPDVVAVRPRETAPSGELAAAGV